MNRVNETYLVNLINDLQNEESEYFKSINPSNRSPANKLLNDDKLDKLRERQAKLLSQLKYNAQALKSHLEKVDHQIKNPKVKVVGI